MFYRGTTVLTQAWAQILAWPIHSFRRYLLSTSSALDGAVNETHRKALCCGKLNSRKICDSGKLSEPSASLINF